MSQGILTPAKKLAALLRSTLNLPDSVAHPKTGMVVTTVFADGAEIAWTPLPDDSRAPASGRVAAILSITGAPGNPLSPLLALGTLVDAADRSGFTLLMERANMDGAAPSMLAYKGFASHPDCLLRTAQIPRSLTP